MSYRDWHVGMEVVCVEEPEDNGWHHNHPTQGKIYTLREIGIGLTGEVLVKLKEVVNKPRAYPSPWGALYGEVSFYARCFKPLQKRQTDISIFTALLNPAGVKEDA